MVQSDIKVSIAKLMDKQYKLTDGNGMHLLIYPDVSLAEARVRRDEACKQIANGIDPSDMD